MGHSPKIPEYGEYRWLYAGQVQDVSGARPEKGGGFVLV